MQTDQLSQREPAAAEMDKSGQYPGNGIGEENDDQRLRGVALIHHGVEGGHDPHHAEQTSADQRNDGGGDGFSKAADDTAAHLHKGKQEIRTDDPEHTLDRRLIGKLLHHVAGVGVHAVKREQRTGEDQQQCGAQRRDDEGDVDAR